MTKREKQWQLEGDADTITRYATLTTDAARFEAAQKHLEAQQAALAATLATAATNKAVNAAIRGVTTIGG